MPYLVVICALFVFGGSNVFAQAIGGTTNVDSADFVLNTTGLSPTLIGGATNVSSGNFALNTTGLSPTLIGGATYADSINFILNTTGLSPIVGGSTYADSSNFTLETRNIVTTLADSGVGSLRQVIADSAVNGVVIFSPSLNGGTIILTNSELDITNDLTILGPGATNLTVSGNVTNRVFVVTNGNVSISGLTIANGIGGIYNSATLSVSNCVITGQNGHGIFNNGTMGLNACSVVNNSYGSTINGVGIENDSVLAMTNCTVSGNILSATSGSPRVGAGVFNSGSLTMVGCTIASNSVPNVPGGQGGGVYVGGGTVIIGNSLIAGNTGRVGLDTFGTFTSLGYNLIGKTNNSTGWGSAGEQLGSIATPLDPKLGPLQNNGGTTPTHALLATSPAIDAGTNFGVTLDQRGLPRPVDNATIANATGGDGSDIGAYEVQASAPVGLDIGLRAYDGMTTNHILVEPGTPTSPFRISKNGTNYGVLLVPTNDSSASKFRIQTGTGVKALKKLP